MWLSKYIGKNNLSENMWYFKDNTLKFRTGVKCWKAHDFEKATSKCTISP